MKLHAADIVSSTTNTTSVNPLKLFEEPAPWDPLIDSETDLLLELDDLRTEIAAREERVRVVSRLLDSVRAEIIRRTGETPREEKR